MSSLTLPGVLLPRQDSRSDAGEAPARDRASLGQYMTPPEIAAFMAAMLPPFSGPFHLLDAGAGAGALSVAVLNRLRGESQARRGRLSLFEVDAALLPDLKANVAGAADTLPVDAEFHHDDFIPFAADLVVRGMRPFTHAILNPPYRKIHGHSAHRIILRRAGIETVNLYSAFVALALLLLRPGGSLAAIIPRSFCNGPYYRPFRRLVAEHAAIRRIHLFHSRTDAFRKDRVLQENVVILLERDGAQGDVTLSSSTGADMADLVSFSRPFHDVVAEDDPEIFIRIPGPDADSNGFPGARESLATLPLEVSTGPVVDFRVRKHLRAMPGEDDAPLLYSWHFRAGARWPDPAFRKANAVAVCPETLKWLYPNRGCYVVVRRLSSKEEKRRIVASVVRPSAFSGRKLLGFENHLNVFHRRRSGLEEDEAHGVALYLNSRRIDALFRSWNGHTQVNAADLRALPWPSLPALRKIGAWAMREGPDPEAAEHFLEEILA